MSNLVTKTRLNYFSQKLYAKVKSNFLNVNTGGTVKNNLAIDGSARTDDKLLLDIIANKKQEALLGFYQNNKAGAGYMGLINGRIRIAGGVLELAGGNTVQHMVKVTNTAASSPTPTYFDFHNFGLGSNLETITARLFVEPQPNKVTSFSGRFHIQASSTILHGELVPFSHNTGWLGTPDKSFHRAYIDDRIMLSNLTTVRYGSVSTAHSVFSLTVDDDNAAKSTTVYVQNDAGSVYPCLRPEGHDVRLGHAAHCWNVVYSINGVTGPSDVRLKTNIKDTAHTTKKNVKTIEDMALDTLGSIDFKSYNLHAPIIEENELIGIENSSNEKIGFLAQDVKELPLGSLLVDVDEQTGIHFVKQDNYLSLVAMVVKNLVNKMGEMQEEINTLKGGK